MTPEVLPGASYGAFWPNGIGYTSLTLPGTPPSFPLYFDVSEDGRIIGKAQIGNAALYWNGAEWLNLGPCDGTNIGAFHPTNGDVYVSDGPGVRIYSRSGFFQRQIDGYAGSNGLRCVNADGSIVTGDQTYGIPGVLGQHVPVGEWRIGQGIAGGIDAVIEVQTKDGPVIERRHVCDGDPRSFRVKGSGDAVTIYWTDYADGYRTQTSFSELRALPIVTASNPEPPTPNPVPVPQPPTPEPVPVSIPNIEDRLNAERAKYGPKLSGDECVALLNAAAYGTGFKLYRKAGGRGKQPRTGIPCSTDLLGYPDPSVGMRFADVLGSTGSGEAVVNWPSGEWEASKPEDVGNYIDPVQPDDVPDSEIPNPPPQQPPPVVQPPAQDLSAILQSIEELRTAMYRELADMEQYLDRIERHLEVQPPPAQPVKFPDYQGSIPYLGPITLRPKP